MEYYRFGRVVVPEGGLFDDIDSAIEFAGNLEDEVLLEQIQNLSFTTDDEGTLTVLINNKRYFITLTALKDLCKLLKVPASYINKFPGRSLVLENLNNNPYLKENADTVKLVVWQSEDYPVIAGVLPGTDPAMQFTEFFEMMRDNNVFTRESTKLDQIALTSEEAVAYFYLPEEMTHERFSFNLGYALRYSATRFVDTTVTPFVKMTVVTNAGEPFDFDFESSKKLRIAKRKKEDFLSKTLEICQAYQGEDLGVYYEEAVKCGTVARNLDSVKYSLLKFAKSKAVSTYNYSGVKVDGNQVTEEVIPEYLEFYKAHKDDLKQMETYAANNLRADFYLPIFLNRFFTFQANIENPNFMIRYRKAIGSIFNKTLDEVGDLLVDVQN